MKIFYDYRIFYLQKYGGISRYFTNLNKELNHLSINSIIYAPISVNTYLKNQDHNYINHFNLNKIYKITKLLPEFYNDFFTNLYLKKFKPDLIHLTYFQKNLKIKKQQPIVVTVHDLIHEKYFKDYNLNKNNKFKKKYLDAADHIICVSKSTREDLLNYYDINPSKITVIYHGIDDFQNKENYLVKNLNNKKKFILYVGDRVRYKNFEILLKAFELSKNLKQDFQIVCVGGPTFSKLDT